MSILFSGKTVQLHDLPEKFHNVEMPENPTIPVGQPDPDIAQIETEAADFSGANVNWEEGQVDFKELINDFETELIVKAMKFTEGNKKEAARLLKLKRTTLLEKIKKKNISSLWED